MKTKAALACAAWLCLVQGAAFAGWLQEIEVEADPVRNGRQDYTVRIRPARTHTCSRIRFECVYHQSFPWVNVYGEAYTKVHEPVSHVHEVKDVRLVNDLDSYHSFRIPVALDQLQAIYGTKVFNSAFPVSVSRLRVAGYQGDTKIWSREIPAGGKPAVPNGNPAEGAGVLPSAGE